MSGLEEFQASEDWRSDFKKFIFLERKPVLQKPIAVKELQRCSLDIGEDLQAILRDRKREIELEKQEIIILNKQASGSGNNMNHPTTHFDDTYYGVPQDLPMAEKVSDESFEALENMCNKTASDPDSTLFQYLNSDHQEQILADAKKRSTGDANAIAVKDSDPLLAKFSDFTLLDDIEAPSRIWDNTIVVDGGPTTSPVKMVGLLRPSTIMEETADESESSDISSLMSFQTATKGLPSDVSSVYDTAHESTVTSTNADLSIQKNNHKEEEVDVDKLLEYSIKRSAEIAANLSLLPQIQISTASTATKNEIGVESTTDVPENSIDLTELENTFSPLHNSPHSSLFEETVVDIVGIDDDDDKRDTKETEEEAEDSFDESVINILSDEDDFEDRQLDIKLEDLSKNSSNSNHETYGLDENKENCLQDSSRDRSMNFNDTMEEVEYLLKKGMEYMAARDMQSKPSTIWDPITKTEQTVKEVKPLVAPIDVKSQPKLLPQLRTSRTQPNTPMSNLKKSAQSCSVSKVKCSSFKSPAKCAQSSSNRMQIGMRPFPKLDVFCAKSSHFVPGHPRQKELTSKQSFSHIVSPVGAYMKKTASTPLMVKGKMKNRNVNVMNSAAFRELEYESRLYQPKVETNSTSNQDIFGPSALPGVTGTPKTLPKKAYISSELKHIVDERTPFTIPGGKKIQKYLENAMMPAVLRHDGKMKFPRAPKIPNQKNANPTHSKMSESSSDQISDINTATTTKSTRRNNASLADLSVMSGDVSMYTIMDARKF